MTSKLAQEEKDQIISYNFRLGMVKVLGGETTIRFRCVWCGKNLSDREYYKCQGICKKCNP